MRIPDPSLAFVSTSRFTSEWRGLGLDDDDLRVLEQEVVLAAGNPRRAPTVRGTGGLQKMRFAPEGAGRGRSGALRVGFYVLRVKGLVLLVMVYAKGDKAEMSAEDRRYAMKEIQWLQDRFK